MLGIQSLNLIYLQTVFALLYILPACFTTSLTAITQNIPRNINCNFNVERRCGWSNSFKNEKIDDFNWRRGRGSEGRQRGSGSGTDHGRGGGYLFIKSRKGSNRTAKAISPQFSLSLSSCFQFWYFMKGKTLGHLAVQIAQNRSQINENAKTLWNLRGHQGNEWKNAKIPLEPGTSGVLILEAFDWETGKSGNILIDDITLTPSQTGTTCTSIFPSYAAPPILMTTAPLITMEATGRVTNSSTNSIASGTVKTGISTLINYTNAYVTLKLGSTAQQTEKGANINTVAQSFSNRTKATIQSNETVTQLYRSSQSPMPTWETTSLIVNASVRFNSFVTSSWTKSNQTSNDLATKNHVNRREATTIALSLIFGILGMVIFLALALKFYFKRRRKPRTLYADDCSVIMTRMYPEITAEPSIDYRKFT